MERARDSESLRDFQARLAERLRAAQAGGGATSKLGFVAGDRHWLVSLDQVEEVVTVTELAEVPWARPWFVGVASVRGSLYGCTDLAAYLGLAEPLAKGESRLLLAHPRFGINAALRVERALGLRAIAELAAESSAEPGEEWALGRWRDADGQIWTEISVERLLATPGFQEVGT
jgi:twitching motility protein PilI